MKISVKRIAQSIHPILNFQLFCSKPLWKEDRFDRLIDILCENSEFIPDFVVIDQKRLRFDPKKRHEIARYVLPYWIDYGNKKEIGFHQISLLRNRMPRYEAIYRQHSGQKEIVPNSVEFFFADMRLSESQKSVFANVVDILASHMPIDVGFMQFFSVSDRTIKPNPAIINARKIYYEYIPDLCNLTIWGKPYIDLFERERILATPCAVGKVLSSGVIWMQLGSELIGDSVGWTIQEKLREDAKRYLNNNAFRDPHFSRSQAARVKLNDLKTDPKMRRKFLAGELLKEINHKYTLPKFDFSELQATISPESVIEGQWEE